MDDVVGERRIQDGWGLEFLSGNGGSDNGEDSGADDRADAQRRQRPGPERLFQPMFRLLRLGDQLVNGLTREELVRQVNAPGSGGISSVNSNRKRRARASRSELHHEGMECTEV